MKPFRFFVLMLGWLVGVAPAGVWADEPASPVETEQPATVMPTTVERVPETPAKVRSRDGRRGAEFRSITRWGGDAVLPAGETVDNIVALFGAVYADGIVKGNAVAIFGPASLGSQGSAAGNVVGLLGAVRVDGPVSGNVVSVLGGVELGPKARVSGNVVSVGAAVNADPAAVVKGNLVEVATFAGMPELKGLQAWVRHALLLGRPLALHRDVLWAWGVAGAFWLVYLFVALLMNGPLVRCAETLEQRPGKTVLAAFLTVLLTPLLFVVLSITVVGAPLLVFALLIVSLIGKAAFLCWLGRRVTLALGLKHAFAAVAIGGLLLMGLYVVPFLGFLVMKLTDALGVGMVVYALILSGRREKPAASAGAASPAPAAATAGGAMGSAFVSQPEPARAGLVSASFTGGAVESSGAQAVPAVPVVASQQQSQAGGATAATPARDVPITSALPRAGFRIRLAALLIDWMLVFGAGGLLLRMPGGLPLLMAAYLVVLWALKGTTVGGIICNLKIVRLDDQPLTWTTAIVRGLAGFLSVLPAGLGFLWVIFDEEKQAWHDKVAGTVVVRAPKGLSLV